MSEFLYRLGSWSYRKVWPFLAFWLIVLVAMVGLTAGFAKSPNPNFSMPEMDSTTTQDKMMERFGQDTDAMSAPLQIAPPTVDPKSLGKVAVLFGGDSAEREISIWFPNL